MRSATGKGKFFVAGGTLKGAVRSYIEREADEELYQRLTDGEFCYLLTSRQVGKSSLVVRVAQRLRAEGAHVALIDLTIDSGKNVTAEQWYRDLIRALGDRLELAGEMEAFVHANAGLSPKALWHAALRQVALERVAGSVVVIVDEIDFVRGMPFSTDEFFADIRACYNARSRDAAYERLTFCLVGSAAPTDLIRDARNTPFNIGTRIPLRDFTEEEVVAALSPGLACPEAEARTLLQRVHYWTGGHPYLTQRLCALIADALKSASGAVIGQADAHALAPQDVDRFCGEAFLSPQPTDDNIKFVVQRLLDKREGFDAANGAAADRADEALSQRLELYRRVVKGRAVAEDEKPEIVSDLLLAGVVRSGQGRLAVRNPIYASVFDDAWITENMPDAARKRAEAAVRAAVVRIGALAAAILLVMGLLTAWALHSAWVARRNEAAAARATKQANLSANEANLKTREAQRERQKAVEAGDEARNQKVAADNQRKRASRASEDAKRQKLLAERQSKNAIRAGQEAKRQKARAEQRADDAERLSYIANVNLIPELYARLDFVRIDELLNDTRNTKFRGFEWGYWHRLRHLDLMTLKGHTSGVTSVAFSPDGGRIVTGSADKTAKVWDAATGRETLALKGHTSFVTSVAFSPDGRRIVTGSADNSAKVWDAATGRETLALKGHTSYVTSVAFSPDGGRIVTGSDDNTAKVWDAATGRETLALKGHTGSVSSVAFSPDGRRIVTGSGDNTAKVWDAATGRETLALKGHTGVVTSVAFSPDGRRIVTGSADNTAKVWDAATGRETLALKGHTGNFRSVAFSPDGRRIVTGSDDDTAKVWDAATGRETLALKGHTGNFRSVAFSPDGRRIVTGSDDDTAKVWYTDPRDEPDWDAVARNN